MDTHKEEFGEMAEVEATQLSNEHLKFFTAFYTEKMANISRDEAASANIDEGASNQEDSEESDEDDDTPYEPSSRDFQPSSRDFHVWERL